MRSPVLLLLFDRPSLAIKTFKAIRIAKPPRLYIAGDGPNLNTNIDRLNEARAVAHLVDWDCEVKTLFQDENLGCGKAVSGAITWFFSLEAEGVILEDDCLPSQSFFKYVDELLEKYRHDYRVGVINGTNFINQSPNTFASYGFSKYVNVWGWASWRDRWSGYDQKLSKWPSLRNTFEPYVFCDSTEEAKHWQKTFSKVFEGRIDTWDYQWVLENWVNGRISITPSKNLVSNIGFGIAATHTIAHSEFANLISHEIEFPLQHPDYVVRNRNYDIVCDKRVHRISLLKRILNNSNFRTIKKRLQRLAK